MKNNKKKGIVLLSIISICFIFFLCKDRITFEYYVWNLSSESYEIREKNANRIIKLGRNAIPKLVNKLDDKYIYETDYIVYCLEEITLKKGNYNTTDSAIKFWKNWAKKNGI